MVTYFYNKRKWLVPRWGGYERDGHPDTSQNNYIIIYLFTFK